VVRQSDLVGDEDQAGVLEQLEVVDSGHITTSGLDDATPDRTAWPILGGLFRLSMHLW
jgi:hypothetical protein